MLTIYCEGPTPDLRHGRWVIAQYEENDGIWNIVRELPSGRKLSGSPYQMMRGNAVVPPRAAAADFQSPDLRGRYSFRCPKCAFVTIARSDNFRPLLTELASEGVSEISTRDLATRLSGG